MTAACGFVNLPTLSAADCVAFDVSGATTASSAFAACASLGGFRALTSEEICCSAFANVVSRA
jgi:hypothetical protein